MFSSPSEPKRGRRPFTAEEDERLRMAVDAHPGDWESVSQKMPGRNERQCKERWEKYLDPALNMSEWTPEEDNLICECVEEYGRRWSKIYVLFHGRSSTAIKNRWNILERRRLKEERQSQIVKQEKEIDQSLEEDTDLSNDMQNDVETFSAEENKIDEETGKSPDTIFNDNMLEKISTIFGDHAFEDFTEFTY